MKTRIREDQQRALNRRSGSADRASEDWPSRVLHDRGPVPKEGLDEARLARLADFIETLEVMDTSQPQWALGPVGDITIPDSRTEVLGYLLTSGGHGYGAVCFQEDSNRPGYYMTGYGLVCWGWGTTNGMASVAANGHVNALQDVLTAEPVRTRQIPDLTVEQVTGAHVADALRQFIDCRDAHRAWWLASGLKPGAEAEPAPVKEPPLARQEPEAKVVSLPGTGLTGNERWKHLVVSEEYEALRELCEGQVARLEGELATWRKRLAAAKALIGGDEQEELDK